MELDGGENGNGNGSKNPLEEITENEIKNTDTTDKKGNRVVVPAGFKVVNPESTVEEGIVIEDINANNTDTIGNQFVWIPCEIETEENKNNGKLKYDRYAFTRENPTWNYRQIKLDDKDEDGSYKIQRVDKVPYYFHESLSQDERQSIEKYEGYYIGRYEVGCNEKRTSNIGIATTAKVQAGLNVYNYVTRDEAKSIAERMYEGKSKLCSSYAWDTALKFIDGDSGTYSVNSEGENYNTSEVENTGYHGVKNIYDMGGNIREWTTESSTNNTYPNVFRGGTHVNDTLDDPAGGRHYDCTNDSLIRIGVRVTFYNGMGRFCFPHLFFEK